MIDLGTTSIAPQLDPRHKQHLTGYRSADSHGLPRSPVASPLAVEPLSHKQTTRDAQAMDRHRQLSPSPAQKDAPPGDSSMDFTIQAPASGAPVDHAQTQTASHAASGDGPSDTSADSQLSSIPSADSQAHLDQFPSSRNSQDTMTTNETDQVFTPPASETNNSEANGSGSGHDSSQESQLLQLSQIAAAQERMQGVEATAVLSPTTMSPGLSRKRMADGMVKHGQERSSASPVRFGGHSRNTSTISVASTAGSRISELSAELKARLSYAMVKVNNGWQSRTIDEVENLASQAASPTSSTSTIHGRRAASTSPQLPLSNHRLAHTTTPGGSLYQFPPRATQSSWRDSTRNPAASPPSISKGVPTLAPPVSIQPSRPGLNGRRNSNPRYTPAFLSTSSHASPHTPAQPSPIQGTPDHRLMRTPIVDPILFSPHQNVREQDAIESLLFMSSPGNSANLKHAFPPSSQPASTQHSAVHGAAVSPQRTALPNARKSLPTGRPSHSQPLPQSHSHPRRVGFEKSPSTLTDMDVDDGLGTPRGGYSRTTPRRKANGGDASTPRQRPPLSVPAGLSGTSRNRPSLGDADIERMLDRVTAAGDDSDSDEEIEIPLSGRSRREGADVRA
ncbi:Cell cycle transcriptional repressor whi5 [Pleurostoma richardsiae]|uniref:Cell cycle transcriptional repressor whi5 n=1 Tax=Pleurostoma richardsiae TaxID=41990 RepID=A0AA38RI12_9PEZI|nr:Cell cycle transcriptional repressor whi5 [Pleurostoma richardsiae]